LVNSDFQTQGGLQEVAVGKWCQPIHDGDGGKGSVPMTGTVLRLPAGRGEIVPLSGNAYSCPRCVRLSLAGANTATNGMDVCP
jgi:hypothetical protein